VVVPAALMGSLLVPRALRAAVPQTLSTATTEAAVGVPPISPLVLSLTHEVVTAMTLAKWKLLSVLTIAAALTTGGVGAFVARADEKKPGAGKPATEKPAPAKPGEKPATKPGEKPGEKPAKPKPTGEKPAGIKVGGTVGAVDAKAGTITLTTKGDKGPMEKVVKLAADARVFIDGKAGELAAVPKGSFASLVGAPSKQGDMVEAGEVRITGPSLTGVVTRADAAGVTLDVGGKEGPTSRTLKLTADTRVNLGTKEPAKPTDLKAGDKVAVVMTSDGSAALVINRAVVKPGGDKSKPGDKPKPSTDPAKPGAKPAPDATKPSADPAKPTKPAPDAAKPTDKPKPSTDPAKPGTKSAPDAAKPGDKPKPNTDPAKPADKPKPTDKPAPDATNPKPAKPAPDAAKPKPEK
jgi:hypothetical protein